MNKPKTDNEIYDDEIRKRRESTPAARPKGDPRCPYCGNLHYPSEDCWGRMDEELTKN